MSRKKRSECKNKSERLQIVLEICKKLKQFPKTTAHAQESPFINLYNSEFAAISQLKKIFHKYVEQNDEAPEDLRGFSGKISFPEIARKIEYILPIGKHVVPFFVLRHGN